jgi:hypothetical protein
MAYLYAPICIHDLVIRSKDVFSLIFLPMVTHCLNTETTLLSYVHDLLLKNIMMPFTEQVDLETTF